MLKGDPDAVIGPNMDGVLITPPKSPGPPQYFFAFSRKHPLLFYALLETFQNLLSSKDIMSQYVPYVTGT